MTDEIRFDPPLPLPLDETAGRLFNLLCVLHAALSEIEKIAYGNAGQIARDALRICKLSDQPEATPERCPIDKLTLLCGAGFWVIPWVGGRWLVSHEDHWHDAVTGERVDAK